MYQCPHQTTQHKLMMHYVKSGDKRTRVQLDIWHKKIQQLIQNTLENYLLKSTLVCVCVCHHSFLMIMVSKQCSYTFTPAFSVMACTGIALTSSSLGTEIWTAEVYQNMAHIQGPSKKCIHTLTKENSTLYNRLL